MRLVRKILEYNLEMERTKSAVYIPEVYDSALSIASLRGHTDLVEFLLSYSRVDPSYEDNSAIKYASKNGHVDIVKLCSAGQEAFLLIEEVVNSTQ